MTRVRLPYVLTGLLLGLIGGCSAPPKPPTVDESRKRPVNDEMAVALQVCQIDLNNTRLLAIESDRQRGLTNASLAQLTVRHQLLASLHQRTDLFANQVHTIRFAYGSSQVDLPPEDVAELLAQAQTAPFVLLRGRTDGLKDSPAESRLAQARAETVRDLLVNGGVNPSRIRSTYQPVGDPVAENHTLQGRALNRRVEIELYRALPVSLPMSSPLALQRTDTTQPADLSPNPSHAR